MSHFLVQPSWRLIITDLGLNVGHVLRSAQLPADLFSREEAYLSTAQYFKLWQATGQLVGNANDLPLRIAQSVAIESFSPLVFACMCSANLNVALKRLAEFKSLLGPMTLHVEEDETHTCAQLRFCHTETPVPTIIAATELVFFTQLARIATRQMIVPSSLALQELPSDLTPYTQYFGRPIEPGTDITIAFSKVDAECPFLTENSPVWQFFEPTLRKQLSELTQHSTTAERVKSVLLELLPTGRSSIDAVAKTLAMSVRSLQRHLHSENLHFQEVLHQTRKDLAQHYLKKSHISLNEIAYLLGFHDSQSFARAFKKWQGQTPLAFRKQK
ncbi:AraC family transcriptional regulator [Formosimonas limnophila]|nr:AraC family transcriptional regulator [Formosimonas limnophila]